MSTKRIECIDSKAKTSQKKHQKPDCSDSATSRVRDANSPVSFLEFHKGKVVQEYLSTLYH
jgi:hypothetical protein